MKTDGGNILASLLFQSTLFLIFVRPTIVKGELAISI